MHTSAEARDAASAAGARAFATGSDIVVGEQSSLDNSLGKRFLLAHELAHVAQQQSAPGPTPHSIERDPVAEREADLLALRLTFGLGPARPAGRRPTSALLASPLSTQTEGIWTSTSDKGRVFDVLREQPPPISDPDLDALLSRIFPVGSDDLWLAQTIVRHGPEPRWPASEYDERRRRQRDHGWTAERGRIRGVIAQTAQQRPVEAYFFSGTSDERALVIAGVHGSEQGGIEVAEMLIQTLHDALIRPYYSVIIVPTLFPDNAAKRKREGSTPTNRNFPAPGKSLAAATPTGGAPVDSQGHALLPENIALLQLIERFRPTRIASIHGTWDRTAAGIFSDAHTVSAAAKARAMAAIPGDSNAAAEAVAMLQAEADSRTKADQELALSMARAIKAKGFAKAVLGNRLSDKTPSTGWKGGVPGGTSLGGWAPQDITEGLATDRPSMTLITVEVATDQRSTDFSGAAAKERATELASYREVIQDLFLAP